MLVGEGPGRMEDAKGRPFVGAAGGILDELLARIGLVRANVFISNVTRYWVGPGNRDPKPEEIEADAPLLEAELREVRPKVVAALGRVATQYFRQVPESMELTNGFLYEVEGRPFRVFSAFHPALGLHDGDQLARIVRNFERLKSAVRGEMAPHAPRALETEVVGLAEVERDAEGAYDVGIDTEFDPGPRPPRCWGLTLSVKTPRAAAVLAGDAEGLRRVERVLRGARRIYVHNLMADLDPLTRMLPGIDLRPWTLPLSTPRVIDTMVMVYHGGVEAQGLKALAARLLERRMPSFEEEILAGPRLRMQMRWLEEAAKRQWPDPKPVEWEDRAGNVRVKRPWGLNRRLARILKDFVERPDECESGGAVGEGARRGAEAGRGGVGGRCRWRPCSTRRTRTWCGMRARTRTRRGGWGRGCSRRRSGKGLIPILDTDMPALPLVARMEAAGIPAHRQYFVDLAAEMRQRQKTLRAQLEEMVCHPINPNSPDQVALTLFDQLGLPALKGTSTGKRSTGEEGAGAAAQRTSGGGAGAGVQGAGEDRERLLREHPRRDRRERQGAEVLDEHPGGRG